MVEFETEVTEVIKRTHDVKSFRFKKKDGVDFKAGQFLFVTIKIGGAERTKHFSFSRYRKVYSVYHCENRTLKLSPKAIFLNSPTEKGYIEFTKKLTESDYSKALDRLKAGDWAKLKLPYGSFTYESEYKRIAFLSGGIGITPIRSICKYLTTPHD